MAITVTAHHTSFPVKDLGRAHLKARGLAVFETSAEVGQIWVRDPDGHIIELIVVRG